MSAADELKGEQKKVYLLPPTGCVLHLSDGQVTALYRLFAMLDSENTGKIDSYVGQKLGLDGGNSGGVSFGVFLQHFCLSDEERIDSSKEINEWIAGKEALLGED